MSFQEREQVITVTGRDEDLRREVALAVADRAGIIFVPEPWVFMSRYSSDSLPGLTSPRCMPGDALSYYIQVLRVLRGRRAVMAGSPTDVALGLGANAETMAAMDDIETQAGIGASALTIAVAVTSPDGVESAASLICRFAETRHGMSINVLLVPPDDDE